MKSTDPSVTSGRYLPIMEEFYSLQGEGFHTGKAAYFVRIGGCDVGCHWCDIKESWDASVFPPVNVDETVENALKHKARSVVVTGGEPLMYNLEYFCRQFRKNGFLIFLETSGSHELSGFFDWICLSPKKNSPPLDSIYPSADELKIIIEQENDFQWAEDHAKMVNNDCYIFLQPEWSKSKQMMPVIVEYIQNHPQWQISLQSHKYMRIP